MGYGEFIDKPVVCSRCKEKPIKEEELKTHGIKPTGYGEKIRLGQHAFILWPNGFGVYDITNGMFDFSSVKDLEIVEVMVVGRTTKPCNLGEELTEILKRLRNGKEKENG
jgi:hypothetical protein